MPIAAPSQYRLITSQSDFETLCEHLSKLSVIALDTEFVRTRTLQPLLGLIQVYDGEQTYLIDPLGLDSLLSFAVLLKDAGIVKVLHACSEDLEVFLTHMQTAPQPLFDTQFAAHVLGMGMSLGYAKLVELECNVLLDKGESRTDWLARPLSDKQLHYAANDVIYLYQLYQKLQPRIFEQDLQTLVYSEFEALSFKKATQIPAQYAYLTFSNNWKLNDQQRFVLRQLAAWRLDRAREKNIAINFVVKEAHLLAVSTALPTSKGQLANLGLLPQEIRKHGDALVSMVTQSLSQYRDPEQPTSHRVPKVRRLNDVSVYKQSLAQLKNLCIGVANKRGIAPEILASKKQLNQLLKWWWFELEETSAQGLMPDLLLGWRKSLLHDELIKLLGAPTKPIH